MQVDESRPGRFRLSPDGQAGAFHCLRLPMLDVGRRAARAIVIGQGCVNTHICPSV